GRADDGASAGVLQDRVDADDTDSAESGIGGRDRVAGSEAGREVRGADEQSAMARVTVGDDRVDVALRIGAADRAGEGAGGDRYGGGVPGWNGGGADCRADTGVGAAGPTVGADRVHRHGRHTGRAIAGQSKVSDEVAFMFPACRDDLAVGLNNDGAGPVLAP